MLAVEKTCDHSTGEDGFKWNGGRTVCGMVGEESYCMWKCVKHLLCVVRALAGCNKRGGSY